LFKISFIELKLLFLNILQYLKVGTGVFLFMTNFDKIIFKNQKFSWIIKKENCYKLACWAFYDIVDDSSKGIVNKIKFKYTYIFHKFLVFFI